MTDDKKDAPRASTPEAAVAKIEDALLETAQPPWRPLLEAHTGWRDLTAGCTVKWKDDGVEVADCSPEAAAGLQDVIETTRLYGYTPRIARAPGRPGIRAGF